jgi:hypothetical protein
MPTHYEKEAVLSKISADPIFATGELYQAILRYLFSCYQQGYQPTEIDLAVHVFGKKEHFNPAEDTLVRVYFYRLRKKLDQYYNGPGKNDPLRLTIPKGHHYIEFKPASSFPEQGRKKWSPREIAVGSVVVVLLTGLIGLWIQYQNLKRSRTTPSHFADHSFVWSDFVNKRLKTSIVVGDLFSFYLYRQKENREWLVRDDQINSYNELQAYIQNAHLDPSTIYLPGWDIVPKTSLIDVLRISNMLSYAGMPLEVKITTEVTLEDIRNNNIVFIGHFHNLKHLNRYLPNAHFFPYTEYRMSERHPYRHIRVVNSGVDTLYQLDFHYGETSALNSDYVLVSRVPGPMGNVFVFFISFLSLGRIEAIKILTDEVLFSRLTAELKQSSTQITPYFEMLIEVKGQEEKGFETQVKHFFPLPIESAARQRK